MCDRAARNATRDIPPGEYTAESFLDDDGVERGKPIPIKVKVKVTPERMTIDFSDISDQVKGSLNSGFYGGAMNVARIAFKCLTTPHLPSNEGCCRALEVICPPGKLVHAVPPAALGDWAVPFPTVLDTIFRSLADAIQVRIPAATGGAARGIVVVGLDGIKRKFFALHFPHIGGHGARPDRDAPASRCGFRVTSAIPSIDRVALAKKLGVAVYEASSLADFAAALRATKMCRAKRSLRRSRALQCNVLSECRRESGMPFRWRSGRSMPCAARPASLAPRLSGSTAASTAAA